jgi:Ca2+-transporting ATPase
MVGAFITSFGLMILGVYAPGLSHWLELVAVGWESWVMTIVCVILHITFVETDKFIIRKMQSKI